MPVDIKCEDNFPLSEKDVQSLWNKTIEYRDFGDDQVSVHCVTKEEITLMNEQYRGSSLPTNVLTFSYKMEHDIALCYAIAQDEARERKLSERDYTALLLVHAFLHVTGLDHEKSPKVAKEMNIAEQAILDMAGYMAHWM